MSTTILATKRAVGYQRVSSTGQVGERHSSLDTHKARFEEYCHRFDLLPVASFVDVLSGKRDDRKEYLRLVEFVMAGGADVIVVQFFDRVGRNPRGSLPRFWQPPAFGFMVGGTGGGYQGGVFLFG